MRKNTKIVAIVSARGGSKGIPKKNIKLLGSKPLIIYSLELLSNIKLINKIIVSTESNKIKNTVKKYFPTLEVMYRPEHLAQDKTPLTSVVKYVSECLARRGEHYNFVLQVAPTCPFIKKNTVCVCESYVCILCMCVYVCVYIYFFFIKKNTVCVYASYVCI